MVIWRCIRYIYIIKKKWQIKNVINRSRDSMEWIFCSLMAAMLCVWIRLCVRAFRAAFDGKSVDRNLARRMLCILQSWMNRPQCLQYIQKWGASRTEENLINPEKPWYGSEDRLVWFCNFFFVDRTQKIKIKKWFQKWFLTPGTHSNPLNYLARPGGTGHHGHT